MFDIKAIRDNPAAFDAGLARRGLEPRSADLLDLDARRRALITEAQEAQSRRNAASKDIGRAKKAGEDAQALIDEVAGLKTRLAELEAERDRVETQLTEALAWLPNTPADDVPDGADENDNVELRRWGTPAAFDFEPREHFALGEALGQMDFEAAAALSGSRFVVLKGALARLERALGQFMLDVQTADHGYEEVTTPVLVREDALFGTGQLPKFADDLFRTTDDRWLIPTAEVTLTNLHREQIVEEESLPRRYAALTYCFRSEAGAAGRDTRGMIRQHQFNKVELVSVTTPEAGEAEQERKVGCAEAILQKLGLAYRVVSLCTGDLGATMRRTYDIEVWLAGQQRYREISSVSWAGDYQARRMNLRCRPKGERETRFCHTLNGSGLAVGRTLIAVMEAYQAADGSIAVPEVLKPYMGGLERIAAS
ncbi:seryl-tRNA synthetase [Rhodothalassium salexigens DSM 2132]|uniref:Serine--tRNA ligase n=1 Tax=Rhodothalassium salexigens DSM 2132 TaxID=1188247 RepID=A0A4R2PWH0_RHOSA|nr:serine--tRNA ligase [Rhodothalassium salexigens]MBB4210337.1 seryl-tRNA synthetase [Rhodothalassium salexigens DSM 2132]MBK1638878.1 serine--tRNA ligase [Rhodothalassium salexigens DSM 2132]TCP38501.1 seryl-tRNA synthetase [Rhodothalassium salexigens DSM 2132]